MSDDVKMVDILDVVTAHYSLSLVALLSNRKTLDLREPRHVACYLGAKMSTQSLPQIAVSMRRDHSTVIHSRNKIAEAIRYDKELAERVMALELAAMAMAKLRKENMIAHVEPQTPLELARLICARGARAACGVSVSQIQELCEALVDACEDQPPPLPPPPPPSPIPPRLQDLRGRMADLVALQLAFRDRPTLSNRQARDEAVEALRNPASRSQTLITEIVKAFDIMKKNEFTMAEKEATQKFNDRLRCAEHWLEENRKKHRRH